MSWGPADDGRHDTVVLLRIWTPGRWCFWEGGINTFHDSLR